MGYIGNALTIATIFVTLIAIITATPDRVCLNPLTCFVSNALFTVKKVLMFSVSLVFLYGYIASIIYGGFKLLRWISRHPLVLDTIKFLVNLDEESFQRIVRQF